MDISEYRRRIQEELDRAAADAAALREMLDRRQPSEDERRSVRAGVAQRTEDDVSRAVQVVHDRTADLTRRTLALETISVDFARHQELIDLALALVRDTSEPAKLRWAALTELRASTFRGPVFAARRAEFLDTLRGLVDDPDPALRDQALEILAQEKDDYAQRRLLEGLQQPARALVAPERAIQFLGYDVHAEHYPILRELVRQPPNPLARLESIRVLGSDPNAKDLLTEILTNRQEDPEVRTASAASLQALAPEEFAELAKRIVLDENEDAGLRAAGISALDHVAESPATAEPDFVARIQQLRSLTSGELQRAATRFVNRRKE
jgi:hypothetical protein